MSTSFTDTYVRNLKATGRYTDSATQGLNLQLKSGGGKYWTFRYQFMSRRYDVALGSYPTITLKEARARATASRNELNQGLRPSAPWKPKQDEKHPNNTVQKIIFSDFAKDCIDNKKAEWRNEKHVAQWYATIKQYADPVIGINN